MGLHSRNCRLQQKVLAVNLSSVTDSSHCRLFRAEAVSWAADRKVVQVQINSSVFPRLVVCTFEKAAAITLK